MKQSDLLYLLALGRVSFLRTREKLMFLEIFADLKDLFRLNLRDLEAAVSRKLKVRELDFRGLLHAAEGDLEFLNANPRVGVLPFWEAGYPAGLREVYDPPFLLFYRGRVPSFMDPLVAIVGTRQPSGRARSAAYRLALQLSARGIGIVSGLARGVDTAAHLGSLEGRGSVIAVLGNGIDRIYPAANNRLGMRILESGGVIFSEFPPGTPPLRYNFPKRNRIISGLARSVVVIQAPARSGALITADYALEQGRDIYVHRAGLEGSFSQGSKKLADQGAPVIETSDHLFYDWGWNGQTEVNPPGRDCFNVEGDLPGLRLAGRLLLELEERYITYNGEYFRRL